MESFYALATEDYRRLEAARDWGAELTARARADGRMRLLDVACGSGRFPSALLAAGFAERNAGLEVAVNLLDPSPFSLAETRRVLRPPFVPADDLQIGVEQLDTDRWPYDAAWAVHALYAVPPEMLGEGLRRMSAVIRPGGLGMVAQATAHSHYLRVYEAYRAAHAPGVTPFTTAEHVVDELWTLGADLDMEVITYRTVSDDTAVVEGFLQRCLFDDTITLDRMLAPGPGGDQLAGYLDGCRDGDRWSFGHEVFLLTWTPGAT